MLLLDAAALWAEVSHDGSTMTQQKISDSHVDEKHGDFNGCQHATPYERPNDRVKGIRRKNGKGGRQHERHDPDDSNGRAFERTRGEDVILAWKAHGVEALDGHSDDVQHRGEDGEDEHGIEYRCDEFVVVCDVRRLSRCHLNKGE